MKKISISSDKKIKVYMVLIALVAEVYFYFLFKELRATMPNNIMNVWQIIIHCSVVAALIAIISKMQCSIWMDDIKIRIGHVLPKSIFYSNIKNIEINESIIIHSKDNKKDVKIEIINFEENRSKYKELLEVISEQSCLDLNIDRVLDKIQKNSCKEKQKRVLYCLNIYLVVSLINLVNKFINFLGEESNILTIVLYCSLVASNIFLIYLMTIKYKHIIKFLLGYIVLRFFILHILIEPPNCILSLAENVYFDFKSNAVWTILLLINIAFIILFKHYFNASKISKHAFTNERILFGNSLKKINLNARQKLVLKIGVIAFIAVTIYSGYLIVLSEIKTDKNYYSSMTEIINNKYKNTDAIIIGDENYFFVFTDEKKSFVIKNSEGKYIVSNNWHEETKSIKNDLKFIDIESVDFKAFVDLYTHNNNYIMLIEQYLIKGKSSNVVVYDNFNEWEPIEAHGSKYFYKVLDSKSIKDDYQVMVDIDGKSYYLVSLDELIKVE